MICSGLSLSLSLSGARDPLVPGCLTLAKEGVADEARSPAAAAPACASAGPTRAGPGPTGYHHPIPKRGQVAIGVKAHALSRADGGGKGRRFGRGAHPPQRARASACL